MENWGLCTFQATALLYDEATSALDNKERVSYVIAHGNSSKHLQTLSLTRLRACSSVVWQSRHNGLVERSMAQGRLCHLGRLACSRSFPSR